MFTFNDAEIQAEWVAFQEKVNKPFEEKLKPILRQPPTSDVPMMLEKLAFLAGWAPWLGEARAKSERFLRIAKAETLARCPAGYTQSKLKIWLEGEVVEVLYLFDHISVVYESMGEAGNKLQTILKTEREMAMLAGKESGHGRHA